MVFKDVHTYTLCQMQMSVVLKIHRHSVSWPYRHAFLIKCRCLWFSKMQTHTLCHVQIYVVLKMHRYPLSGPCRHAFLVKCRCLWLFKMYTHTLSVKCIYLRFLRCTDFQLLGLTGMHSCQIKMSMVFKDVHTYTLCQMQMSVVLQMHIHPLSGPCRHAFLVECRYLVLNDLHTYTLYPMQMFVALKKHRHTV